MRLGELAWLIGLCGGFWVVGLGCRVGFPWIAVGGGTLSGPVFEAGGRAGCLVPCVSVCLSVRVQVQE